MCGAETSSAQLRSEVAKRLSAGDIAFVLDAEPKKLLELASNDPEAPFFIALRAEDLNADPALRSSLYALSWSRAKGIVRREAGRRLIRTEMDRALGGDGRNIDGAKLLATVRRFHKDYPLDPEVRTILATGLLGAGDYKGVRALFTAKNPASTDKERGAELIASVAEGSKDAKALIERFFLDGPVGDGYEWALAELTRIIPESLSSDPSIRLAERAARARLAVNDKAYNDALFSFKRILATGPGFLFAHPETLSDAGRAFQFGSGAAKEGALLFERWGRESSSDELRFRLLFYSGRMYRQIEEMEKAAALFEEALPFAPDAAQREACLWYVLDGAVALSPASAVPLLRKYVPLWKSPGFFNDFLEKYCGLLVADEKWPELLETFRIIRPVADSASVARYAYVIGRAVSLGYIGTDRPKDFLVKSGIQSGENERAEMARVFFRIAFESDEASFYYRCLAASRLGENLDLIPAENHPTALDAVKRTSLLERVVGKRFTGPSEALKFLSAFFEYGVADKAYPFARILIDDMPEDDVRSLSRRFAESQRYGDSIRAASSLSRRSHYKLTRADMELLYPRAFAREITDAATRWGIPEERLFGLVRTESAFISDIVSNAGAEGLAQLMRPTARDVADQIKNKVELKYVGTAVDLRDPATNVQLGARYLSDLQKRLKSPLLALFSYNGGITRVKRWRAAESALPEDLFLETVPFSETRNYACKVLAAESVYGYLYRGKSLAFVVSDFFPTAR